MPTVNSNVKLITSNQAPTTSNLAKGEMAFGQVGGVNSIYGNTGNGIIKIEFTASGEPIIYFANEEALNTFVEGDDVPTSGWYAAIADTIYEQYGEWVAYKITFEDIDGTTTGVYKPTFTQIGASSNGNAFYNLVPNESGIFTNTSVVSSKFNQTIDTINMGNYAHTRYFLYSTDGYINNLFRTYLCYKQKGGNQYRVELNSDDFILEDVGVGYKASIDYNMDNYTGNPGTDAEDNQYFTIWQSRSSDSSPFDPLYLVLKEIRSEGKPWIDWDEILALDSGEEPEPVESYVQFDLGSPTPLGDYINSVSFSNRKQVGEYPLGGAWSITDISGDEYNINLEAGANSGPLKITVDAYINFFGMPDNNPPEMDVSYIAGVETKTNTIQGVYDSGSKRIKWQGSFTIDNIENQTLGCWASIKRYYENDSPTLKGTIKFEAIDG